MIPAILAAPLVQGVVSGVVGSVMNCFAPSSPEPASTAPASGNSFSPYLNRASAPSFSPSTFSSGIIQSSQWNQMGGTDLTSWMKSLQGSHVNATDNTGKTISGVVSAVQQTGGNVSLNIGGHLVSLSQLHQISWSPAIA